MSDNFQDQSRKRWTSTTVAASDQVKIGSLQRIAEAAESMAVSSQLMATNYLALQNDLAYYKARAGRLEAEVKRLKASQRAFKGAATKARKARPRE